MATHMFTFSQTSNDLYKHETTRSNLRRVPSPVSTALIDHAKSTIDTVIRIIGHHCSLDQKTMDLRVAPIEYVTMQPVMSTRAMFVLQHGELYGSTLKFVWVPLALAIHKADGSPGDQARLRGLTEYDMYITINTAVHFMGGDSNCSWAEAPGPSNSYSLTSVLLHEVLHGMGIYSLIEAKKPGAFRGYASVFDAQIARPTGEKLLPSQDVIYATTGEEIAGQAFQVAGNLLYNPLPYQSGSSLSHFGNNSGIMYAQASTGECNFALDVPEISALKSIGWNCSLANGSHTWSSKTQYHPATSSTWSSISLPINGDVGYPPVVWVVFAICGLVVLVGLIFSVYSCFNHK